MGSWNFKNIGASANHEHKQNIKKIFTYIGYSDKPAYQGQEDCMFLDPDVYACEWSDYERESGHVKESFFQFDETDLLNLLNALFPMTQVFVHSTEGNDTSDTWESHDCIYYPSTMTRECEDSYTDYGGDGPNGKKTWKERFAFAAPKMEYVESLIDLSSADGNTELTTLLVELLRKLKNGLLVYEDDGLDTRKIGEEYDVEEEGELEGWDEDYDEDEEYDEDDDPDK